MYVPVCSSLFVCGLTYKLRGIEDALSVSGRQRSKLSVNGCGNSGFGSRSKFEVIFCSAPIVFNIFMCMELNYSELNITCIADEPLEITYSYWDGAGHRRVIQVSKPLLR